MTHIEKAAQAVADSSVAVMVLLNHDNTDAAFVALKPRQADFIPPDEFTARRLRPVGVVGLQGLQPVCAFKEPLEAPVVNGLAVAFLEYVRVMLGGSFEMHPAEPEPCIDDSVAWLSRLYALPDTRMN